MGFIGLCLLVELSDGTIVVSSIHAWYASLSRPPLMPPVWLFAPVWSVLYVMIGVAGWMVWQRNGASQALRLWGWQLAANALWVPFFFGLHSPPLSLIDLAVVLVLTGMTFRAFRRVRRIAGWLMAPYLAWCLFAFFLNAGFVVLNPV